MRQSTFNLLVAIWCAAFAAFGSQETWAVAVTLSLAVLNLVTGLVIHRRENANIDDK